MKKLLTVVFFSLLIFTVCFAENGMKYIDAKLDPEKLGEANADLSQVDVVFCDRPGEKSIAYTVSPYWVQDICLKANNASSGDIEVTIEFVDGAVTNDQRKNKACMQQWENTKFGKYVTGFLSTFTLPANSFVYKHAQIKLPRSSTGIVNWCLVYYTKGVEMGGKMNFTVLMRKAKFIDIQIRENLFTKKYLWGIVIVVILWYGTKLMMFSKKTKKLPKR